MTYWVDNVIGSDTFNGEQATVGVFPAGPKASLSAGIALLTTKGDVLNVVNTGTPHVVSSVITAPTGQNGTSVSDPSFTIRGSDSSGAAAMPEIQWTDTATVERLLGLGANSSHVILEGLHLNWTANATAALGKHLVWRLSASASAHIRYCHMQGKFDVGGAILFDNGNYATDAGDISYCWFEDISDGVVLLAPDGRAQSKFHNNVLTYATFNTGTAPINLGTVALNPSDHRVYNNTVCVYDTVSNMDGPFFSWRDTVAAATPTVHCHSNVVANFQATQFMAFMDGNAGAGQQAIYAQTIGYNIFVDPNANGWGTRGPYEQPFDPGDAASTDIYPTDVAAPDPFHDKSTPWVWDFEGSGYSVTLPGDLRMDDLRTASLSGGVPGAIAEAPPLGPNPPAPPSPVPIPGGDAAGIGPNNPGIVRLTADFVRRKNVEHEARTEFRPDQFLATEAIKMAYVVPASTSTALPLPQDMEYLILLTDSAVTVTINTEPMSLQVGGAILVAKATVSSLSVNNASTVKQATITYFGVD